MDKLPYYCGAQCLNCGVRGNVLIPYGLSKIDKHIVSKKCHYCGSDTMTFSIVKTPYLKLNNS